MSQQATAQAAMAQAGMAPKSDSLCHHGVFREAVRLSVCMIYITLCR